MERLKVGKKFPDIRAGDSIQIEKYPFMTSEETVIVKGVVIAKTNKRGDSAVDILNVSQ
jgi:hypothetical protein